MSRGKHSKAVFDRLPLYLGYLKSIESNPPENISSAAIAAATGFGNVLVRKDLASVCSGGKPKIGYRTSALTAELETVLGHNRVRDAVIVGAGKLGRALLDYKGFDECGINIVSAFDCDESKISNDENGKKILPVSEFSKICRQSAIKLGILTVPAANAQTVCNMMIENGIMAIWNFAPVHLEAPPDILIYNENMAASLAYLSNHLSEKLLIKESNYGQ